MRMHSLTCFFRYLTKLCDAGHADIDLLDFIPGPVIHFSGFRKAEDTLKGLHSPLRLLSVDTVCPDLWDQGIMVGYGIQLLLKLLDFLTAASDVQGLAGPGDRNAGDLLGRVDIKIFPVIIAEDLDRRVILIAQILGAPLGKPVGAADSLSVTVLGQDGLPHIGTGKIACKHFIHNLGNALKNVPVGDPLVVEGGGGGDGEGIALIPVRRNIQQFGIPNI